MAGSRALICATMGMQALDCALVAGTEDFSYGRVEQKWCPSWARFDPATSVNGLRVVVVRACCRDG